MTPAPTQIKARHVLYQAPESSAICRWCKSAWPCHAAQLLAEVERLDGNLDRTAADYRKSQQKLAQAEARCKWLEEGVKLYKNTPPDNDFTPHTESLAWLEREKEWLSCKPKPQEGARCAT